MPLPEPVTEIIERTGRETGVADVGPTPWIEACHRFGLGGWFWLATVQPDGAPHVMPVYAAWDTAAFFVASDPSSRKSRNLVREGRCVVSKDAGDLHLVVEGIAQRVLDDATLERAAAAFGSVYGRPGWSVEVEPDDGDPAPGATAAGAPSPARPSYAVWEIRPTRAFGFPTEGEGFAPTSWRFPAGLL